MAQLVQELVYEAAARAPEGTALRAGGASHSYAALAERIRRAAVALGGAGAGPGERVGVWLDPCADAVHALFGAAAAGAVMVPVDPAFRARQAAAVLRDSGARVLVTSAARARSLASLVQGCALRCVLCCDGAAGPLPGLAVAGWDQRLAEAVAVEATHGVDTDVAALVYVAGAGGAPSGVALSHRSLVAAAASTVRSLGLVADDRVLAALPFSLDFGLNQLASGFAAGAELLLAVRCPLRELVALATRERASVLAAQPSMWAALARRDWSGAPLRCVLSAGGAVPAATVEALRHALPHARIHLVYGLAEAFRATCLEPGLRPPTPPGATCKILQYHDDTIRTCGHRVSPRAVEQVVYGTGLVEEAAAVGVAHPVLGQVIAVLATPRRGARLDSAILFGACRARLPGYMLPAMVDVRRAPLPRGPNGKIDRALLAGELAPLFAEATP